MEKGVEVHGMPALGGESSIFTTLLDQDGNGKVEAAEMMPAGMGARAVPHMR